MTKIRNNVLLLLMMLIGGVTATWAQKTLPYSYGFENYDLDAEGWTKYFGTSITKNNNECGIVGDAKKTGSYGFRFSSYQTSGANAQYLISPELSTDNGGIIVSFEYKTSNSNYAESFKVGYSTTDTDVANFTWGDEISYKGDWKTYNETFPAGTKYVAVYYYSNYQYRLYVDDFKFEAVEVFDGAALKVYDGENALANGYAYNFGLAVPGTEKTFTLKNPGVADATVSVAATNGFGAELSSTTLAAEGEVTLTVKMADASADGTVTISSTTDGIDDFVINVSGTVRDANKVYLDFADGQMPDGWSWVTIGSYASASYQSVNEGYISFSQYGSSSYACAFTSPKLNFEKDELVSFKTARYGSSTYYSPSIAVEYSLDGTSWTTIETYTDDIYGTWTTRNVNIPVDGVHYIRFNGWYIHLTEIYGGELPLEAKMVVTASDYSFGMIAEATATTFNIKNTGRAMLTGITVTTDNDAFVVSGVPTSLDANADADVTVTMSAAVKGAQSGVVTVKADGMDDVSFNVSGYVVDDNKIYVTFDDNKLPEGWSDNTGWTFSDGKAVAGYDTQMTLPALTVAEGEKMAILVKATGSYQELYYFTSTDGGTTWSAKSSNLASSVGTDSYTLVYIDGLAAGNYKLKLQGYHVMIDAINGFSVNNEAPALTVDPTTAADFGKVKAQPEAKTYTVSNSGTGTLTGTIASSDTEQFTVSETEFSLAAGESMAFDIALVFDDNYGEKAATITVHPTNDGLADVVINATATTKDPNVWEEDFEEGTFNDGWIADNWTISTPGTYSGGNGTKMAGGGSKTATLISPRLIATEGQTLTFDLGGAGSSYPLTLEYSADRNSWTEIASYTEDGTINVEAPVVGNFYLRFTGWVYIDNISGFKLDPLAHDATISATNVPATGTQYAEYTASVTVKEMAGKAETLTAKFFIGETQYGENVVETVDANGTKTFTVTFTPDAAATGDAYFTVSNDDVSLVSGKTAVNIAEAFVIDENGDNSFEYGTQASVVVKYSPKAGWNTVVMPFAVDDLSIFGEGVVAYEYKSYSDGALNFQSTTSLVAGYPYVLYVETPVTEPIILNNVSITGTTAKSDHYSTVSFNATYAPIAAPDMEGKYGIVPATGRIQRGSDKASLKAMRGYFLLDDTSAKEDNGEQLAARFVDNGVVTTISLETVLGEDGQQVYDLGGRRVTTAQKGIYIVNGKKIVF